MPSNPAVDWIQPWASEINYASGPYAGLPTKVAPVGDVMTPNTKPPAQNFNFLQNDRDRRLQSYIVSQALGNWGAPITTVVAPGPVNATLMSACWNFNLQRWTGMFFNGGNIYPLDTHDSGQHWEQLTPGGGITSPEVIASASTGTLDCFCHQGGGGTQITTIAFNGSPSTTTQSFLGTLQQATMYNIPGLGIFLVGSFQTGGTMTGHGAGSTTGGSGVWTDTTSSLPSAWQSATNHVARYCNANDGTFLVAGNNYLVGMCGVSTSDTSRILRISFGSVVDITPSVLTGRVLTGLAYSQQDALWGLVCWDASGFYLYTSPDLTTWTLIHNFGSGLGTDVGGDVAVIGGVWCVQLTILDSGSGTTDNDRLMISADVGPLGSAAQWTTASYNLIDDAVGGIYPGPQMRSNNHQLLAWNNGAHMFSQQVGFTPQGDY